MEKSEFASLLSKNGFPCSLVNGIPTIHANMGDKATLKQVKALKKEHGYDKSFAIKYDGAAALSDDMEDVNEDLPKVAESKESEPAAEAAVVPAEESENSDPDLMMDSGFFNFDTF